MEAGKPVMLVVDDEAEILKLFKEIFELRGWQVLAVPTGEAALAIIKKQKITIVLLDICLPDRSGIDILKDIKSKYPKLPVVMITALGYEDEPVNKAIAFGASGYVSKTVAIKALIIAINILVKIIEFI